MRPALRSVEVEAMKVFSVRRRRSRIAADLVQREKRLIAVEGRILDTLRMDAARVLLQPRANQGTPRTEALLRRPLIQEQRPEKRERRPIDRRRPPRGELQAV